MLDKISHITGIPANQVQAVAELLDSGATIPFIARYRKELTGSRDEVEITAVRDALIKQRTLEERKKAILNSLEERELLTKSLKTAIEKSETASELEDLYEQYRPKKRTRAQTAREKGLEPLAMLIMAQDKRDPMDAAAAYVRSEKGIHSLEDALAGARDILAETINDNVKARHAIRLLFSKEALISSSVKKGKNDAGEKFRDYFDWSEPAHSVPSHRILAMMRGESASILTLHALPPEEKALSLLEKLFIKNNSLSANQLKLAIKDSYKRLLGKSIETELLKKLKLNADETAIKVFTENIEKLLLSPPLGQKSVLAIDPGFRTGCKVVCLDPQGKLLAHDVIFPLGSGAEKTAAILKKYIKKFKIEALAIGNGTAGRETESFVRKIGLPPEIDIVMVDESGASIYSASACAREEFPDHDITVRGAVSIGRRLMDPLAELVKIDPKSIGVGQYQHDVDQKFLQQALDDAIVKVVNRVGVEVNTASKELLSRVSGLNHTTAANLVHYRTENGPFRTRRQLLKVPRLGPKAFEQAAGFLRIHKGKTSLDASGIHPESYKIVEKMSIDHGVTIEQLMADPTLVDAIDLKRYANDTIGMPTLRDIAEELKRPGRDPRDSFNPFAFADYIHEIKDLSPGMKVPGIITNVTAFGAFVDIGVHQDGLIHISQMADRFVKNPAEIVTVRQPVTVTILDVDIRRKRISLSLK